MTGTFSPPEWLQAVIALVVLAGAVGTLIGTVGLARLATFSPRIHPPPPGPGLGAGPGLPAPSLDSPRGPGRAPGPEGPHLIMVLVTTPVTLVLLARAALYRDVAEGNPDVPALPRSTEDAPKP